MLVVRVDTEIEDVLLGDAQMLEQLPRRVLEAGGAGTALVSRNPVNRLVKPNVRLFAEPSLPAPAIATIDARVHYLRPIFFSHGGAALRFGVADLHRFRTQPSVLQHFSTGTP